MGTGQTLQSFLGKGKLNFWGIFGREPKQNQYLLRWRQGQGFWENQGMHNTPKKYNLFQFSK